jgi:hypothetical protein
MHTRRFQRIYRPRPPKLVGVHYNISLGTNDTNTSVPRQTDGSQSNARDTAADSNTDADLDTKMTFDSLNADLQPGERVSSTKETQNDSNLHHNSDRKDTKSTVSIDDTKTFGEHKNVSSVRIRRLDNYTFEICGDFGEDVYEKRLLSGAVVTWNLVAKVLYFVVLYQL